MRNLYIGALLVHDSVLPADLWLQAPIQGLESPDMRVSVHDKPGEDGSVITAVFYGSRTVTLNGFIRGATAAIYEANCIAFLAACVPSKDAFGYPTPTRITFTTLSNNTYYFDAYIKPPVMDYDQINFRRYLLTMRTADPYIYSTTAKTTTISRAIGGGAIVPFVVPVTLSASSGGTGTVVNSGNGTSYPILTLTGPLTNPYIANTTVGKAMQLNYTIPSGNTVIINMAQKTIMLNGTTSLLSAKTIDSEWWALVANSNNIQFSTSTTADTGYLKIDYNDAYIGI